MSMTLRQHRRLHPTLRRLAATHPTAFANFNQQDTSFDNVIVRISPRKQSQYRFQAGYTPKPWAVLGGSINIFQQSNGDSSTNYQGHNRNYGLTASLAPNEHFALDLAYNYNDVMQNALICFDETPPPG